MDFLLKIGNKFKFFNETTQNFFYPPVYKIDKEQEIKIFIETINFISGET